MVHCPEINVRADNPPALAAYRRLGYVEHVRFEEREGKKVRVAVKSGELIHG